MGDPDPRETLARILVVRAGQCLAAGGTDIPAGDVPPKDLQDAWKTGRDLLRAEVDLTTRWAESTLSAHEIEAALTIAEEFLGMGDASSGTETTRSDTPRVQ